MAENTIVTVEAVENQNEAASILEFMKSNAKKIEFCDKKKIVLVMGGTGVGKTTLVSLITKVKLRSFRPIESLPKHMISDEHGLISDQVSTTISKTMIPNLMVHEEGDTTYYDCPGFNDSRGVANDISVSYFTRQLIRKVSAVKLIFAIPYSEVEIGLANRHGFLNLAEHATTFIKNIDQYKDGIALIVTKVPTMKSLNVNDKEIIDGIAIFLSDVRANLIKESYENPRKMEKSNRYIQFIDILLKKNKKLQFERIVILRLADEVGPVENMKVLQDERRIIKKMVHDLTYVKCEDADFGYTISDESKNEIHKIIEDMQLRLLDDVGRLGDEIKQFYLQREECILDINKLINLMSDAYEKLSRIQYEQLGLFEEKLEEATTSLNVKLSAECRKKYAFDVKLLNFLQSVSHTSSSNLLHISDGLNNVKKYLKESYNWYNFLLALHDHLSTYDVQKNTSEYRLRSIEIKRQCNIQRYTQKNINDIDLKQLARDIGCEVYYTVDNIFLNSFKLKTLTMMLEQTLDNSLIIEPTEDKLVVKGYNVKISDIGISIDAVKFVEVFALNNLFIDADIVKIGQNAQVSFIAPKWYIIGDRKIKLNGEDGESHSQSSLERSKDGLPGKPGGAAGNFFGIGKKSYCDQNLSIQLDGGKGGPGQDGAKGEDGIRGDTPPTPSFFMLNPWKNEYDNKMVSLFDWWIFGKRTYSVNGTSGTEPTDGGKGGRGGFGGNPGECLIQCFTKDPKFLISKIKGDDGCAGKGGDGGQAADSGDVIDAQYIHILYFFNFSSNINAKRSYNTTRTAKNGADGGNNKNIESPPQSNPFYNPMIVNNYIDYMKTHMTNNVLESVSVEFMKNLEEYLVSTAFEAAKGIFFSKMLKKFF